MYGVGGNGEGGMDQAVRYKLRSQKSDLGSAVVEFRCCRVGDKELTENQSRNALSIGPNLSPVFSVSSKWPTSQSWPMPIASD